jgi:hypothetical protein
MPSQSRGRAVLGRLFEIDLRALAAFRISIGLLLAADLCERARDLRAHYTDAGVLPRAAADELFLSSPWHWSVHALGGDSLSQTALFGLALAVALAMVAGAWTRLATLTSWLLLASLHARNPMLLFGADHLLRMLLFWSMFVPLGERWSFDSTRAGRTAGRGELSVGSAALLLQPAVMYVFAGIFKLNESWSAGDALQSALSLEMFAKPPAARLVQHEEWLAWFGPLLPWMEVALGAMLFVPWKTARFRALALALLALLHLSIWLLFETGSFQLVCLSGLLLFLPRAVWERVSPGSTRPTEVESPHSSSVRSDAKAVLVGLLALYGLAWNIASLSARDYAREHAVEWMSEGSDGSFRRRLLLPGQAVERRFGTLGWVGRAAHLYQQWNVFEQGGGRRGGWHLVRGTLVDGSRVDALATGLHSAPELESPPTDAASLYPGIRWRVYFKYLTQAEQARALLPPVLIDRWERAHPDQPLRELEVFFLQRRDGAGVALPDAEASVWSRGWV